MGSKNKQTESKKSSDNNDQPRSKVSDFIMSHGIALVGVLISIIMAIFTVSNTTRINQINKEMRNRETYFQRMTPTASVENKLKDTILEVDGKAISVRLQPARIETNTGGIYSVRGFLSKDSSFIPTQELIQIDEQIRRDYSASQLYHLIMPDRIIAKVDMSKKHYFVPIYYLVEDFIGNQSMFMFAYLVDSKSGEQLMYYTADEFILLNQNVNIKTMVPTEKFDLDADSEAFLMEMLNQQLEGFSVLREMLVNAGLF